VSYARGYKEHHCRFIFRFKELPLARLARAMGLLRLPRMKEIRKASKASLAGFEESSVDPDGVPFADKARERQRVRVNAEAAAARAANPDAEGADGSRRERERRKREEAIAAAEKANGEKRMTAAKRRLLESREDVDDINDDYRALKKLKKGKISEEDFDLELGFEQPVGAANGGMRGGGGGGGGGGGKRTAEAKGALHGAALKASMKKEKPKPPRHIKNSRGKGGGRGAKAMKKKKFAKK
jgi:ATP-dependent RNA helicase DDX55/SPB4